MVSIQSFRSFSTYSLPSCDIYRKNGVTNDGQITNDDEGSMSSESSFPSFWKQGRFDLHDSINIEEHPQLVTFMETNLNPITDSDFCGHSTARKYTFCCCLSTISEDIQKVIFAFYSDASITAQQLMTNIFHLARTCTEPSIEINSREDSQRSSHFINHIDPAYLTKSIDSFLVCINFLEAEVPQPLPAIESLPEEEDYVNLRDLLFSINDSCIVEKDQDICNK